MANANLLQAKVVPRRLYLNKLHLNNDNLRLKEHPNRQVINRLRRDRRGNPRHQITKHHEQGLRSNSE